MHAGGNRSQSAPGGAPGRRSAAWLTLGIVVLAALPRLVEALRNSLVFDEIYGVFLARLGPAALMRVLAQDVDQPLHALVLCAWRIPGEGQLWLKAEPMLFGLATIVAVAALGREMFGSRAGLWAAALLASSPTHIYYSQEVTFHAMCWLLLLLSAGAAWRWRERGRRGDALTFVMCSALALWAFWFSAFALTAMWLWVAVALRREPRRLAIWLGCLVAVAALYLPELSTLIGQLQRLVVGDRPGPPMPARDVLDVVRKLNLNSFYLIPVLGILAALPLLARGPRRPAGFLWFTLLVPIAVPFALSHAGAHIFVMREMFCGLSLWTLLVGAGIAAIPAAPLATIAGAALVLLGARAWVKRGAFDESASLERAAAVLRARGSAQDFVLCAETRSFLFMRYHLRDPERCRLLDLPGAETFHYSDGILVVPDAWRMSADEWARVRAGSVAWWGVRFRHSGRDGPVAGAWLDSLSSPIAMRFGKATLWRGGAWP
jgi:mannosyltransferase